MASILTVVLLVGPSSCATSTSTPEGPSTVSEAQFSGFLDDYSRLEPVSGESGTLLWINPEVDLSQYDKAMVDPVVTQLSPELTAKGRPDPETIREVTNYLREALRQELGAFMTIVDEPGEGVKRIQVAISGAQVHRKELGVANYLPVGLVVTGAGEITGARDRTAYLYMEGHTSDSLTGVTIIEVVQSGIGKVAGKTDTGTLKKEQVRAILDFWVAKLKDRLFMALES